MDIEEYRKLASRTLRKDLTRRQVADNIFSGILGEAGEVMDLLKKEVFHGQVVPRQRFVEELGDLLWYIALIPDGVDTGHANIHVEDLRPFLDVRADAIAFIMVRAAEGNSSDYMMSLLKEALPNFGATIEEVMEANIAKLERRYKDGFSSKAAVARADEAKLDFTKEQQRIVLDALLLHAEYNVDETGDRADMLAKLHASLVGGG